jgi:hypothetical protein
MVRPSFSLLVFPVVILLLSLFVCCDGDKGRISSKELALLKRKYDAKVLNYFYETVFHEDFSEEKVNNIAKWIEDPNVVVMGEASGTDIGYVKEAISDINDLNLPLKCKLGSKDDTCTIEIFFGNVKAIESYLEITAVSKLGIDTSSHFGLARFTSYDGVIAGARIGIYFSALDTTQSARRKVVLEEIVQALGVTGDSYTYPSSLFFQNHNLSKDFTDLDKQVLSLLYEPSILPNYARKSFEMDFSDELYAINSSEKLKLRLNKYPKGVRSGTDVEDCFLGDILLKHPKEVNVFLYGAFTRDDSATVADAILALNRISPNLNIALTLPGPFEPDHGIIINLTESRKQEQPITLANQVIVGKSCMFARIIKNRVRLSVNSSERSKALRPKSLVDALYFSLIQLKQNADRSKALCQISEQGICFDKYYSDLLSLIYSNEFVDGFKLKDFRTLR